MRIIYQTRRDIPLPNMPLNNLHLKNDLKCNSIESRFLHIEILMNKGDDKKKNYLIFTCDRMAGTVKQIHFTLITNLTFLNVHWFNVKYGESILFELNQGKSY